MEAATATATATISPSKLSSFSRQINFRHVRFAQSRGLRLYRNELPLESTCGVTLALSRSNEEYVSPWEDKPFEILPSSRKIYLDEQEVVSFLDPPKELIPLDPASYNPAAYLWF